MHIVNVMFSRNLGGIEQAFIDYCEALLLHNHQVTAIICPRAAVKTALIALQEINIIEVNNKGNGDIFASWYLKKIINQANPHLIINHGSRGAKLMRSAVRFIPQIGVLHNYSFKRFTKMQAIIAVSKDLQQQAKSYIGFKGKLVAYVPNMIRLDIAEVVSQPGPKKQPPTVPVIGTLGRFVHKKGFHIFLESLAILQKRNIPFNAVIGGTGEEEAALLTLCEALGLTESVKFAGWVKDKQIFYEGLDIFCLPSLHEPFGIVLLEAFARGLPVVTTDSEGPVSIATDGQDVLIVPKSNPEKMADALEHLIKNPELASKLGENAANTVQTYALPKVAGQLNQVIEEFSLKNQSDYVRSGATHQ